MDLLPLSEIRVGRWTYPVRRDPQTEKPMLIPEVDFSGIACALGAESAIIRSLADLAALKDWIDAGAKGTFVADCRITSSVRAPWLSEWMQASQAAKAAVAG